MMTRLPKPNIPVSPLIFTSEDGKAREFRIASEILSKHPAGTTLNDLSRAYTSSTGETIRFTYRFFTDGRGNTYAKATSPFTHGAFGHITHVEMQNGQRFVLKEEVVTSAGTKNESAIAIDLDKAVFGYTGTKGPERIQVTLYRNLGINLFDYLVANHTTLTDKQRLDIAIQLTLIIAKLHTGLASKTGRRYVHLDIKPENITIDENGKLHLIDFGFATSFADEMIPPRGTPSYLLHPNRDNKIHKEHADIFSLLRTLNFPSCPVVYGRNRRSDTPVQTAKRQSTPHSILSDSIIDNNPILQNLFKDECVASNDYDEKYHTSRFASATKILAILISVKFQIDYAHLIHLTLLQLESLITTIEKAHILPESRNITLLLTHPNINLLFDYPEKIAELIVRLESTSKAFRVMKILLDLKEIGLTDKIYEDLLLAATKSDNTLIPTLIQELKRRGLWNKHYAQFILEAKDHALIKLNEFLAHPSFNPALASILKYSMFINAFILKKLFSDTPVTEQPQSNSQLFRVFMHVIHVAREAGMSQEKALTLMEAALTNPAQFIKIFAAAEKFKLDLKKWGKLLFGNPLDDYHDLIAALFLKGMQKAFEKAPEHAQTKIKQMTTELEDHLFSSKAMSSRKTTLSRTVYHLEQNVRHIHQECKQKSKIPFFRSVTNPAFEAGQKYFESAREFAGIDNMRWQKTLDGTSLGDRITPQSALLL